VLIARRGTRSALRRRFRQQINGGVGAGDVVQRAVVETELHIDREMGVRREQRTQMNDTRALVLPREQNNREHK
jgi:hypothetical protein